MVAAFTEWFIPVRIRQSKDGQVRARTVLSVAVLAGLLMPIEAVTDLQLHHLSLAAGAASGGLALLLAPLLMRVHGSVGVIAQYVLICLAGMICWGVYVNGGILSCNSLWFAIVPLASVFIAGRRSGLVWSAISLTALLAFYLLSDIPGALPAVPVAADKNALLQGKTLLQVMVVVLALALSFARANARGFQQLESAQQASERASKAIEHMMVQASHAIRLASQESRSIAQGSAVLTRGMTAQSDRAEAMCRAVQEMALLTEQNVQQSSEANEVAKAACQVAGQGGDAMARAMHELNMAGSVVANAASQLEMLGTRERYCAADQ
ncbi:hypothetical protein QU481_17190 [Crenobacter sp. SG2303]|uniref:Methyl-accepting transducer domain-containing protein n=1 Tax=Crenobacter oryzisoli TaxID=3056844 RepID=A0ABT7XS30_9NEIS|nr:hypothetical protein [Crenobacter sp. SG2303]MDN0076604.1 hypothetical protein [Crenobacter sp. SG2303]